ncbi:methyltransferase domain-containing protein [Streptomyces sp. SF28]|nr:methyltransferase domain-containing protein [Streptomyces pinistramenti]MCB5910012.1 methyltransferase domain-containing protein [Streptomyces pinistramenti]
MAFLGQRRRLFTRLVSLSGARPGERILEVGCGTGYLARLVAAAVAPGGQVVGVDPSPSGFVYARRLSRSSTTRDEAGVGEMLKYAECSYDVVVRSLAVHHIQPWFRARAHRPAPLPQPLPPHWRTRPPPQQISQRPPDPYPRSCPVRREQAVEGGRLRGSGSERARRHETH